MPNIVDYNHPTCSRRAFLGLAGAGLLSAAASLGLAGCGTQNAKASAGSSAKGNTAQKVQSTTLFAFDTVVTISAQCSKKLLNTVSERCTYFENRFSRTVEGSDIWNINNAAGPRSRSHPRRQQLSKMPSGMPRNPTASLTSPSAPSRAFGISLRALSPTMPPFRQRFPTSTIAPSRSKATPSRSPIPRQSSTWAALPRATSPTMW